MKRVLSLLLLLVPLIVLGCSQKDERFDHTTLKEELKEDGIAPKLPTKFPMTIVEYERVNPPHETNINEVIFKGEEGMLFSLTIQPPPVEYKNLQNKEVVMVNGNNGFYIKGPGPSLHWTDGDYHYILTSYSEENGTKKRMIETAQSFE